MRIGLFVSAHDIHLLPKWAQVVQHLRCGAQHQLRMIVGPSVENEAKAVAAEVESQFEDVQVHVLSLDPEPSWPLGGNHLFWHCANLMELENPTLPWQLMELDCLPIKPHAFDALAAKYSSCGAPFFGSIDKTPWRDTATGKIIQSPEGEGDVMMSGNGIYPGNMITRPSCKALMEDFMKGPDSTDAPWDVYLRYAMKNDGMAHTELIANHWNTADYTVVNGVIRGRANPNHKIYDKNPHWAKRSTDCTVHPDAVFIHGCKDDSVFNLIMDGGIPDGIPFRPARVPLNEPPAQTVAAAPVMEQTPTPAPVVVPAKPVTPPPPSLELLQEMADLQARLKLAEMREAVAKKELEVARLRQSMPVTAPVSTVPPAPEPAAAPEPEPMPEPATLSPYVPQPPEADVTSATPEPKVTIYQGPPKIELPRPVFTGPNPDMTESVAQAIKILETGEPIRLYMLARKLIVDKADLKPALLATGRIEIVMPDWVRLIDKK